MKKTRDFEKSKHGYPVRDGTHAKTTKNPRHFATTSKTEKNEKFEELLDEAKFFPERPNAPRFNSNGHNHYFEWLG